ncbi:MAG: OmpH family outer membrane protein [Rickettsiales bacterium]|nr:OmpH family outer membrane protein [Rickettsiales bacterium]
MNNKLKITLLAAFTTFMLHSASSFAGDIAVLDIEKIAKESKAVHDIQARVSNKQEEFQKEITKEQSKLEAEQKKLESKKSTFSKEGLEKEQKSFEKKVDALKALVEKRQASLKKASADSMAKVNDKMKDIIAEIAKEKQLNLIIPSSQVVFSTESLDISAEVLEKLNKKVTKIDVKFE